MKRHREQRGYVYKASGVWYVRHHDNRIENGELVRKQVSTRIGLVKDFRSKAEAREEAQRVLAPVNEGSHRPAVVQPLTQFAEQEFFPFVRQQVRPSTANGYEARWRQVKPWLPDLRLPRHNNARHSTDLGVDSQTEHAEPRQRPRIALPAQDDF